MLSSKFHVNLTWVIPHQKSTSPMSSASAQPTKYQESIKKWWANLELVTKINLLLKAWSTLNSKEMLRSLSSHVMKASEDGFHSVPGQLLPILIEMQCSKSEKSVTLLKTHVSWCILRTNMMLQLVHNSQCHALCLIH